MGFYSAAHHTKHRISLKHRHIRQLGYVLKFSFFTLMNSYSAYGMDGQGPISGTGEFYSLRHHCVQTDFAAYRMGSTHLHLKPTLRLMEFYPHLYHKLSWYGV